MPLRLVLLRHDVPADFGRPSHWDLLLEREDDCWTWAVEDLPAALGGDHERVNVLATRLANHRKHYLDYEGPVSSERGTVKRVLAGTYEMASHSSDRVEIDAKIEGKVWRLMLEAIDPQTWNLSTP